MPCTLKFVKSFAWFETLIRIFCLIMLPRPLYNLAVNVVSLSVGVSNAITSGKFHQNAFSISASRKNADIGTEERGIV